MNCPHCGRLVYSRLRRACDFCGMDYPEGIRLPDEEIIAIKAEFARAEEERIRVRAEQAAAEEEEEKKRQEWVIHFDPSSMP